MPLAVPFCALCGARCDDPQHYRLSDAKDVQQVVRDTCLPTAFHHASVLALPPQGRHPLCMPCVNWKRRIRRAARKPPLKSFTPLDSILLHCIAPGHFPEPDQRCFERLAGVAADLDNGFAAVVPERVRQILAEAARGGGGPGAVSRRLLRAWWGANHKTAFFRHAETARAVRHTLVAADPGQQGTRRRWRR